MRKFYVPIEVTVEVTLDDVDDTDLGRESADIVGKFLADLIVTTLIPKPGKIRVTEAEAGYPLHVGP